MSDIKWEVGMKVALTERYDAVPMPRTIQRLTPSGMPVIKGESGHDRMFSKDGRERGRHGGYYGAPRIEPWAERHAKKRARARREKLQRYLYSAIRELDGYSVEEITAAVVEIRAEREAAKAKGEHAAGAVEPSSAEKRT